MNDIITVRGIVATIPRHIVTSGGLAIASFRLASPSRRWDRATSAWVNGDTNWYTVTAFRSLATNLHGSIVKGDRVLVLGRLRVRTWERDDRSGMAVEIDAEAIGHDLAWGTSTWRRTPRHTSDDAAAPGESPTGDDHLGLEGGATRADDSVIDGDLDAIDAHVATGGSAEQGQSPAQVAAHDSAPQDPLIPGEAAEHTSGILGASADVWAAEGKPF